MSDPVSHPVTAAYDRIAAEGRIKDDAAQRAVLPALDRLVAAVDDLEASQHKAHESTSVQEEAKAFATKVIPAQDTLREVVDSLETLVADDLWPLPKYRELLFQY